jgi:ribosome-binding factor A
MASRRLQRLNEQLKREISRIIRREVRDPRVGVVTVTGVAASPDLMLARVWVRTLGDEGEGDEEMLEGLRAAAPHIQRHLGDALRIRRVPELRFEWDETLERARRIEAILDDVRPEGGWQSGEGDDEGAGS